MQQEIEYTFKDGSKHVIPADNQSNFERQFDKEIISRRVVGQQTVQSLKPVTAQNQPAQKKQIVSFPVESPKPVQPVAEIKPQVEPATIPAQDEVIVFEEN